MSRLLQHPPESRNPRGAEAPLLHRIKGADTVGTDSRGYDAGKKTNGRKRHIVTDTMGLLVVVLVTAASVQDRDGGRRVLDKARMRMPSIVLVWADGGYAGKCVEFARRWLRITLEIVKKPEGQRTFEVYRAGGSSSGRSPG